jgi:hypothetical protein
LTPLQGARTVRMIEKIATRTAGAAARERRLVIRRALPRLSIGLAAVHIFLSLGAATVWRLAEAVAQDDPWQWPADQKVEKATVRLMDLKEAARQFSRRDCPTAREDYDAWLDEALDLAGSLIGLQDSTRQIRKTGAGADKLRSWDAVRASNGPDGIAELTDLLGRCGRRVQESDAAFRPPSREELFRRAAARIVEKRKSELAAVGISLEEKDEFKGEDSPPRRIR